MNPGKTWGAAQVSLQEQIVRVGAGGAYRHVFLGAGAAPGLPAEEEEGCAQRTARGAEGPVQGELSLPSCSLVAWKGKTELNWAKYLMKSQSSMGTPSKLLPFLWDYMLLPWSAWISHRNTVSNTVNLAISVYVSLMILSTQVQQTPWGPLVI